jgi:hypothetical protein
MGKVTVYEDDEGMRFYRDGQGKQVYIDATFGQGVVRGIAETPANIVGLVDAISPIGRMKQAARRGPIQHSNFSEALRPESGPLLGPQNPQNRAGKIGVGFGSAVGESVPFLASGGAATPFALRRAAGTVAGNIAAEAGRQTAETAGMGPFAQFVASVVTGGATQGVLAGGGAVAGAVNQQVRPSVRAAHTRAFAEEALRGNTPDPKEAIALLEGRLKKPLYGDPTLEQMLQESAPGLRFAGPVDAGQRRELLERAKNNAKAMQEFGSGMFPAGHVPAAQNQALIDINTKGLQSSGAYKQIAERQIEGIPVDRLDTASALIQERAYQTGTVDSLPTGIMDEIDKFERRGVILDSAGRQYTTGVREANFQQLNELSKKIGRAQMFASAKKDAKQAEYLATLRDAVESTIKETAEATGNADLNELRSIASSAYRDKMTLIDPKRNPLAPILGSDPNESWDEAFKKFVGKHPKPAEEIGKVMMRFNGNEQAQAGIRRLVRDYYFGENFGKLLDNVGDQTDANLKGIRERINRNPAILAAAWGEDAPRAAREFLDEVQRQSSGTNPRSLNMAPVAGHLGQAGEVLRPLDIGVMNKSRAIVHTFMLALNRMPTNQEEINKAWNVLMMDRKLGVAALKGIPKKEVPAWNARFRRAMVAQGVMGAIGVEDPRTQPVQVR